MNNRLFVGQLSYSVDSEALGQFFASAGQVTSARVMIHKDSGRSKGFGFVEMSTDTEANEAIEKLNGQELMGRAVVVAIARPPEARPSSGGGRRFGGGDRERSSGGRSRFGSGSAERGGDRAERSDRGDRSGGGGYRR